MSHRSLLIKPASSLCNMRCKYCFYADVAANRHTQSLGIMQKEVHAAMVQKALHGVSEFCNFIFQGGEPTVAGLDYFKRHMALVKLYNFNSVEVHNSIQTNGYVIDDEWAEFFAQNNFLVGLSLDGYKDIHNKYRLDSRGEGTFERVMETVKLFNKHKVEYNILCVVNKDVAQNAKKVYTFFKSRGFKYLQFIPCLDEFDASARDYSLTAKDYSTFLKKTFDLYYKDFCENSYISIRNFDNYIRMMMGGDPENCGMSGFCTAYFVLEGDGSVYPCDFYVLDKYKMGNVMEHDFKTLQRSKCAQQFVNESLPIDEKCKTCKWKNICRGGCRRDREPFKNGLPSLNKYCTAYDEFFTYSIERMKKMCAIIIEKQQQAAR